MNKIQALKKLQLYHNASYDEIKRQYKKFSLIYHPDKNIKLESINKFEVVSQAYRVLTKLHGKNELIPENINDLELFDHVFEIRNVLKPKITFISKKVIYQNGRKVTQITEDIDGVKKIRIEQI